MDPRIQRLRSRQRALGTLPAAKWSALRSLNARGLIRRENVCVHPAGLDHPVCVRMRGSSDPDSFEQLFVRQELDFARRLGSSGVHTIVDLGANVGFASAFLLSFFKDAFALAVEPDPGNAEQCRRNLAPYGPRARVVEAAVWHKTTRLALSRGTFGDGREWATQVREARPGEEATVTALDMPGLLELCPSEGVDLLKVDIEGSEEMLFGTGAERWLARVRNLCIELHGERCERAFHAAMAGFGFEQMRCGEHLICLGIRRAH